MPIETISLSANPGRQDRTLTQFDLPALGKLLGAEPLYPYLVTMLPGPAVAGNHSHLHKEEIFVCVRGSLRIAVQDPFRKTISEIVLTADDEIPAPALQAVIVRSGHGHAVQNVGDGVAVLLVLATRIARDPDDDLFVEVIKGA